MNFKLKPWHIYLIGIVMVWAVTETITGDSTTAASLAGSFLLWGGIGLVMYYVAFSKFRKKKPDTSI